MPQRKAAWEMERHWPSSISCSLLLILPHRNRLQAGAVLTALWVLFLQADGPGQGNDQRGSANQMPGSCDPGNVSFLQPGPSLGLGFLPCIGRAEGWPGLYQLSPAQGHPLGPPQSGGAWGGGAEPPLPSPDLLGRYFKLDLSQKSKKQWAGSCFEPHGHSGPGLQAPDLGIYLTKAGVQEPIWEKQWLPINA